MHRLVLSLLIATWAATCALPAAAADPWPGATLPAHPLLAHGGAADLEPADAERAADRLLASAADDAATIATAHLMRGLARYRLGRHREAAADLARAGEGPIHNHDVAAYFRAEALFHAGAYADALDRYRRFERDHENSTWRHRAIVRQADCRLALGEHAAAIEALRAVLTTYPEYPHRAAIRYAIAEAERRRGRLDEAARWLDAIIWELPEDPMVPAARRALAALEEKGATVPALAVADIQARGVDLRARKYFGPALDTLGRLLTDPRATAADCWRARYQIGRTLYQMERYEEAHATFAGLLRDPPTGRHRGWARYWTAYSLERLGRLDDAAAMLLQAMRQDPKNPSGEAHHTLGWLYFDGADYPQARKHFEAAARKGRTWRQQTHWWRAWLAYRLGDLKTAAEAFDALRRSSRHRADRYAYWLARTRVKQGELDDARALYRRIIEQAPLSYYAYQAAARLDELDRAVEPAPIVAPLADCAPADERPACRPVPGTTAASEATETAAIAPAPPAEAPTAAAATTAPAEPPARHRGTTEAPAAPAPAAEPDPVPLLAELARRWGGALPDLAAAHELAAIGEGRWAIFKLRRVSNELRAFARAGGRARRAWSYVEEPYVDYRKSPRPLAEWGRVVREKGERSDKKRIRFLASRRDAAFWPLMRDAFAALGDHHYFRRHARKEDRATGRPEGEDNADWRRRYARAFRPLVERHAAHYGLDPHFIWALMTVESTYNPWAISRASARGLMQVMPHTGALVADRMQWRNFGPALLFEPEVATEMAAWYFHQLLRKFRGQLPLAIAGYNAGPHRVAWWLSNKGHLPMDEFVEEIPYTEAREYTKKVLRHLALYRRTYEGDAALTVGQIIDPAFRDNINF